MGLFALEHKRLWRTRRVWLCAALCFLYSVVWGGALGYQWRFFGSEREGSTGSAYSNRFDGYAMIRSYQELAAGYGGTWTDEVLQKMVEDFRTMEPKPHLQSGADWQLASYYLNKLYPELEEPEQRYLPLILYVDTAELTDFYARRQAYLEQTLEAARQAGALTGEDVRMLLEMNGQVPEPWPYEWVQGWDRVTGGLPADLRRMAPFLAAALAFTFSGERQGGAAPLLHTARYGRRRLAWARSLSGLAFAAELWGLIAGGHVAVQLAYLGTDGWDLPIQLAHLQAVAPWNMLQAEAYELAFGLLGAVGCAGVVMLLSALARSNVLSLALSLGAVYVPGLLESYLPAWLVRAARYLPLAGGGEDIFSYDVIHIFGKGVWSPYVLPAVPALLGLACAALAVRAWSRRTGR